jgi:hypothetical protein
MTTGLALASLLLVALAVPEPAPSAGATLDAVAFLAGAWEGRDADGVEMEELWSAPKGNSMLGLHRDVARGRTVSFEFLRIAVEAEGVVYWASPQGRPATPFRLVESGARRAVFANPAHDFPKRILYWIDAAGALHARIEGEGGAQALEWTWRRAR